MNFTENYIKIKEFISEYYWIAGIPFLIWGVLLVAKGEEDINRNQTETYGIVYGARPIYKQYSKRNYKYKFYYNGKKYTGTSIAYNSENIKNGNFYKVLFSYKNPKNNRMIFDMEYIQQLETNENGKVIDTIYIPKNQKLSNEIEKSIEKYKIKLDTIKN